MEKLHHTEQEFWSSSYLKIDYILDCFVKEAKVQREALEGGGVEQITSMRSLPGW